MPLNKQQGIGQDADNANQNVEDLLQPSIYAMTEKHDSVLKEEPLERKQTQKNKIKKTKKQILKIMRRLFYFIHIFLKN